MQLTSCKWAGPKFFSGAVNYLPRIYTPSSLPLKKKCRLSRYISSLHILFYLFIYLSIYLATVSFHRTVYLYTYLSIYLSNWRTVHPEKAWKKSRSLPHLKACLREYSKCGEFAHFAEKDCTTKHTQDGKKSTMPHFEGFGPSKWRLLLCFFWIVYYSKVIWHQTHGIIARSWTNQLQIIKKPYLIISKSNPNLKEKDCKLPVLASFNLTNLDT